jgi:calcium/calmodulin-dependent protein kinase I
MSECESTLPGSSTASPRAWLDALPSRPPGPRYVLREEVGRGSYGVVRRCWDTISKTYRAVKILDLHCMKGSALSDLEAEVTLHGRCRSPTVAAFIESFRWEGRLYIMQQLAHGGDLMAGLLVRGRFCEGAVAAILRDLLAAVVALHQAGVVHRDIKPSNLLFAEWQRGLGPAVRGSVLLADFGFAAECGAGAPLLRQCGTPLYMAPEVVRREPSGQPADVWAVGVTAYVLLSGQPPFQGTTARDLFRAVGHGAPDPMAGERWEGVSTAAKDFVSWCLCADPDQRPVAAAALRHPWLTQPRGLSPGRHLRVAVHSLRAVHRLARRPLPASGSPTTTSVSSDGSKPGHIPAPPGPSASPQWLECAPDSPEALGLLRRLRWGSFASAPSPASTDPLPPRWLVLCDGPLDVAADWTLVDCV